MWLGFLKSIGRSNKMQKIMQKKIKDFLCDRQGKMYVGVLLFLALVLFIAFLCVESMKLYDISGYAKAL